MSNRLRVLLAVFAAVVAAAPARAAGPLQPGARLGLGCTMNFVFDGQGAAAGRVFVGTAAHCVEKLGEVVTDADREPFGVVAAMGDFETSRARPDDWALIEVDPRHHARVDPAVAGHPELPAGVADVGDLAFGDLLQMSGWGLGYGATQTTRERRQAVLTEFGEGMFNSLAPVAGGDSGGPLVHVDTAGALGIVSGLDFGTPGTLNGPMVASLLPDAAAAGLPLRVRLAGEPAPVAPAAPPPPPGPPPAEPQSSPRPAQPARPAKRRSKKRRACRGKARKAGKRRSRCRRRR